MRMRFLTPANPTTHPMIRVEPGTNPPTDREIGEKMIKQKRQQVVKGKVPSLKLTASLHLKMHGWKMIFSFWDGIL